jgi:hypothetical protein
MQAVAIVPRKQEITMMLKYIALTAGAFVLCATINPAPAAAQTPNCADMYNRVMQVYQAAPLSPEYAQMSTTYTARCLGAPAASAYPSYGYPAAANPSPSDYGYAPAADAYAPVVGVGVGFGDGSGWGGDRGGWRR